MVHSIRGQKFSGFRVKILILLTRPAVYHVKTVGDHRDYQGVNGLYFVGTINLTLEKQPCPPVVFLSYLLVHCSMLNASHPVLHLRQGTCMCPLAAVL